MFNMNDICYALVEISFSISSFLKFHKTSDSFIFPCFPACFVFSAGLWKNIFYECVKIELQAVANPWIPSFSTWYKKYWNENLSNCKNTFASWKRSTCNHSTGDNSKSPISNKIASLNLRFLLIVAPTTWIFIIVLICFGLINIFFCISISQSTRGWLALVN